MTSQQRDRHVVGGENAQDQCTMERSLFQQGVPTDPPAYPPESSGSLRHAACARRGLHAAYGALNRFLTSSEDSPYFAEPRGTAEEVNWLYHLL